LTATALTAALTVFDAAGKQVGLGVLSQLSEPPPGARANPVAARALQDQDARLAALFAVLVPERVWKTVRGFGEIVIVPDGSLFALPFEALVTSRQDNGATAWIDDGPAVRYSPSIAMLDAIGPPPAVHAGELSVLSVCNPRFDTGEGGDDPGTAAWVARARYGGRGGSLVALPGTERETDDLVATFGVEHVTALRGADATEGAVRAGIPGCDIIHLATHGLVSLRRSDLLAALALTPVSTVDLSDDGFLQMFEIYDLPVSARLVVLSACESSHGRFAEGEGVMALSNGFHAAGARQVVATLWKVDDEASAALMEQFFARVAERWGNGGDVARSLRDAKRAVRADPRWSHPFYWAAFVASGRP
jgi:CHAT domain-containing protein